MPGFGAYMLAGAAEGLGEGIVEAARQAREESLARLRRQWQKEDRLEERTYNEGVRQQERAWDLEDEQRRIRREEERINRTASTYANVFGDPGSEDEAIRFANSNVRYVTQSLIERGYPPHVAAGLAGNLIQESGPDLDTRAVGDNGNAVGMGQWNGPRRVALTQFARDRGADPHDIDVQIEFLDWELNNSERSARDAILKAETPEEAAQVASERFWRPGVPHNESRRRYAADVYRLIADPDTPAAVREDLLDEVRGVDSGRPLTGEEWVEDPSRPGVEVLHGYDERGRVVPRTTADGRPVTRQKRTEKPEPVELPKAVDVRLNRALADDLGEADEDVVEAVKDEMRRLVRDHDMSVEEAERSALARMEYETVTTPASGGFLGFGGTPESTDRGPFTGRFQPLDRAPTAAGPAPTEVPASTGVRITPSRGGASGGDGQVMNSVLQRLQSGEITAEQAAAQLQQSGVPPEALVEAVAAQAKDAIARGAAREDVLERVRSMGLDPASMGI